MPNCQVLPYVSNGPFSRSYSSRALAPDKAANAIAKQISIVPGGNYRRSEMGVPTISDNFDIGQVDPKNWTGQQIEDHQIAFSDDSRHGSKSIVITTTERDGISNGGIPCQRAELRLHGRHRPSYGEEVWCGFSFKVTGDIPSFGSTRTVIGQWKAPGDESPFLAQRFDNGVFHITIQDDRVRRTVAAAKGDPGRLQKFQAIIAQIAADPSRGLGAVRASKAIADLKAFGINGSSQQSLVGGDLSDQIFHLASESLERAKTNYVEDMFEEFSFIQELDKYCSHSSLNIFRPEPNCLPDPKEDWVDMIYRIKGGRTDNLYGPNEQGEIDIWANGELVACVRGNIGHRLVSPLLDEKMYFKFGMYRDTLPGTINFHFDHFRQGKCRQDVGLA